MACVYWIHLPEHTDMFSEGYVGVTTKTAEHRFAEHVKASNSKRRKNYTICNAIRKHGPDAFIVDTLIIASEDYCYLMESRLRPKKAIGYNIAEGGTKPPSGGGREWSEESRKKAACSAKNRPPMSEETRRKQSKAHTGKKQSATTKQKRRLSIEVARQSDPEWNARWQWSDERKDSVSRSRKEAAALMKPWERALIKHAWIAAENLYSIWSKERCKEKKLSRLSGVSESQLKGIIREFGKGWIPSEDSEFLVWRDSNIVKDKQCQ